MRTTSWQPAKPKKQPPPAVPDDLRDQVDAQAALLAADFKRRFCKKPIEPIFNWPDDVFTRWHRNTLYVVAVMRTPHGRPPTFEMHVAKMEHAGEGTFNLAVPMRKGWNTFIRGKSADECFEEVRRSIHV